MAQRGGVARWRDLRTQVSRSEVRAALEEGRVRRIRRDLYALAVAPAARLAARRVNGVQSHLSAALYWDLPVKFPPDQPVVTVPRHRRLTEDRRRGVDVRWRDLRPDEVHRGEATLPAVTVLDCARTLPFDEALAVADSALRLGLVNRAELLSLLVEGSHLGRPAAQKVVHAADARADNPFESVVRALATEVEGLELAPQQEVSGVGRPDLVDRRLGIVVECDSFEFHARRSDLERDCHRYNACALLGWVVVRFTWEDAMFRPDYVREVLRGVVRTRLRAGRRAARRAPA